MTDAVHLKSDLIFLIFGGNFLLVTVLYFVGKGEPVWANKGEEPGGRT